MTKRYDEPIEVEVVGRNVCPLSFSWRGRRYSVERLLKYWRESGQGWDPERINDHECFRVEAGGGTYDLYLDRLVGREQPRWRLARVWD